MKICNKCGIEKDESKFSKCAAKKDGLQTACKLCKNKYDEEYRKFNIEHKSDYQKEYYKDNIESIKKKHKKILKSIIKIIQIF